MDDISARRGKDEELGVRAESVGDGLSDVRVYSEAVLPLILTSTLEWMALLKLMCSASALCEDSLLMWIHWRSLVDAMRDVEVWLLPLKKNERLILRTVAARGAALDSKGI